MSEHDDGSGSPDPAGRTDPIATQLRRYATAAEARVPATPERTQRHHVGRAWFAAAALVALVAGSVAVFAMQRDDTDAVRSIPADQPDQPDAACSTDGQAAEFEQMHMALPFAATGSVEPVATTTDGVRVLRRTIRPIGNEHDITVQVTAFPDRMSSVPDIREVHIAVPESIAVPMCHPGAGVEHLTEMEGLVSHHDGVTTLSVLAAFRWAMIITANSGEVSDDTLLAIAAGTTWTPPEGTSSGQDVTTLTGSDQLTEPAESFPTTTASIESVPADPPCVSAENQPDINGMRVSYLPDGYHPAGPAQQAGDGPLDTESSGAWVQDFVDPDNHSIRVMNYWSDDPFGYAAAVHDEVPVETVQLARCELQDSTEDRTFLGNVMVSEASGRIVVSAQDGGHGGFAVYGGPGVSRDDLLLVASGLR